MSTKEQVISLDYQEKLLSNTFKLNTKLLNLCGLVPSPQISCVPWKYKLYRVYTCFSLFVIFCGFATTFLAMLEHWDDIERAGESAFVCISFALVLIGSSYILIYWEKLQILMRSTEHELLSNIQKTYVRHLHESKCFSKSLTCFLFAACLCITVGRGYLPLVIHYVRKYLLDAEEMNRHVLNLLFEMWLPFHIDSTPSFLGAYIIQVFIQCISVTHHVSVITYFFTLFIYSCARFRVLISALEDINAFVPVLDENYNSLIIKDYDINEFGERCYSETKEFYDQDELVCSESRTLNSLKNVQQSSTICHQLIQNTENIGTKFETKNNTEDVGQSHFSSFNYIKNYTTEDQQKCPNLIMLKALYSQEDRQETKINKLRANESNSVTYKSSDKAEYVDLKHENLSHIPHDVQSLEPQHFSSFQSTRRDIVEIDERKLPNLIMLKTVYSEEYRRNTKDNNIYKNTNYMNETHTIQNTPNLQDLPHIAVQNQDNSNETGNFSDCTSVDTFSQNENPNHKENFSEIEVIENEDILKNLVSQKTFSINKYIKNDATNEIPLDVQLLSCDLTRVEDYFVECIKEHQDVLRFIDELNNVICIWTHVYSWLEHATVFLSVYYIVQNIDNTKVLSKAVAGLIGELVRIYILCYFGEKIIHESMMVQNTLYDCRWYDCSPQLKKLLHITMTRAQKSSVLKTGKCGVLSYETFSELICAAYIFFIILLDLRMWNQRAKFEYENQHD